MKINILPFKILTFIAKSPRILISQFIDFQSQQKMKINLFAVEYQNVLELVYIALYENHGFYWRCPENHGLY